MTSRRLTALAILALLFTAACDDDESPTAPIPDPPSEGAVFFDDFAEGVAFQAFTDSKADAVEIDQSAAYRGSASLRVDVPGSSDASASFSGGALVASTAWNLSEYDVLTFWARSSKNATLNVAGLGNDPSGVNQYMAEATELDMSGVWRKYMVPLPDPDAHGSETGLFFFAEGQEDEGGYSIWFDDIRFESMSASLVRIGMTGRTLTLEVGSTTMVEGLTTTVSINGLDVTVSATPSYFTFISSNEEVATVAPDGTVTVVGPGIADITASIGDIVSSSSLKITTGRPLSEPAPTPPHDAANVISIYSNHYDNVTVDTWSAPWDNADVEDAEIQGDDMKLYTNLVFAGIEFTSETIDANEMTHFHMDIWTPDATDGGKVFKVKLVDFGADGAWSGGDDVEHEIFVYAPPLASKEWVGLDFPLSDFEDMTTRGHVAQLIISGDPNTVYMDNVYFYRGGEVPDAPTSPAPTPTYDAADVISLFSDPYTDVTVDTWSAEWDSADLEDADAGGDPVKKYTNLSFAGIEFASATIDASEMTNFRMDFWTPDETAAPAVFKVKLVDFGADGAWSGGDDVEHELELTASSTPAIGTGRWYILDIPLEDFTGLTTRGHLAQLIISGDPNTVFVDNVLFYRPPPPPAEPIEAAPTPTYDAANVTSLFSDAYDDVTVDTWSAEWDSADLEDTDVAGNAVKKYSNLVFAGIEFTSETIDATGRTHFRMDIWTPDATDGGQVFKVKLVDFGADGAWSGGDDVEHELELTAATTPGIGTGAWYVLEMPLSDFTGLTTRGHMAQLIISGDPSTVYVDNVLFFTQGSVPEAPVQPAPTPTYDAANVVSLFSDAYTDVTVDTWSASWDSADLEDTDVAGDAVKKYSNLVFAGIEFTSATIDASEMTHFRMDFWSPDATNGGEVFKVKLVDFGADGAWSGGDDVEHELELTAATTPRIGTGAWYVLEMPLADFTALTTRGHMAQLIISGDPNTVFVDNVLFFKEEAAPEAPLEPAPTPTYDAANVVSLFSDAYTDVTVDTWSAEWDSADLEDMDVAGDAVKKYSNLVFAGIEFTSATVDASEMTHFRMDFWSPDATNGGEVFKVKLVDFGADGAWSGGDDVEHELELTAATTPGIGTGAWYVLEMPLADFTALTTRGHMAQLIISGDPNTVFVDNVLFFRDLSAPAEAAPAPSHEAADVISFFSDAYTDVTVDTWSAEWDSADLEDVEVAGNAAKKYSNLVFAGIEFTSATVDATEMTHIRFDFWTPDPTAAPAVFKVKLVDFGADGAWSGGDDVEHEITLDASSTPALATGSWVSYDVPLSDFTGLTTKGHLAQLIISGDPNTVFLDNIYLRK